MNMKEGHSVRASVLCIVLLLCCTVPHIGISESFDASQYTYEDLQLIRDKVNSELAAQDRQYAIEHGDRIVSFESSEIMLNVKKSIKLIPEITRVVEDAPAKTDLIWSSSDTDIAAVTGGTITGKAAGKATITATAKDNEFIFGSVTVHVIQPVTKIVPETASCNLLLNEDEANAQMKLSYTVEPENAWYQSVTWSSSDKTIATVDQDGNIKGLKPGNTKITITSTEPVEGNAKAKIAEVQVTVVQAINSLSLSASKLSIPKGKTEKLVATIAPADATNQTLVYTSSDPAVAAVSKDGTISAKAGGTCTITCETTDGSNLSSKCEVTVIQGVTGIKLSQTKVTININESTKIEPTITPSNATKQTLIWTSSDIKVATVTQTGTIKAKEPGDCVITCASSDGTNIKAAVSVHVPTFHVDTNSYTVTSKEGLIIPVTWDGEGITLTLTSSSSAFNAEWSGLSVKIIPLRTGNGTITLYNEEVKADSVKINITVEHSAVYDTTSYPAIRYDYASRYPDSVKGDRCSFSGRVLQVINGLTTTSYRISSSGRYKNVVYVTIRNDEITTPVIENDQVTVYGTYGGNYSYSSIFGAGVTIPSVNAERINVK